MNPSTNAALTAVLPELAVAKSVDRRRLHLILGGTAVFMAVVAVAVFTLLAHEEKIARGGATKFATALVHNDAAAAPDGASDYIRGIRARFGAVSSARVIGAHNKSINTGDNADTRSFYVVEELLQTRRGPVAIELQFDNHSLSSDRVSSIHELKPGDAPGLSAAERTGLKAAFAKRGGDAAGDAQLRSAPAPAADSALLCVQAAHGDVDRLARCG